MSLKRSGKRPRNDTEYIIKQIQVSLLKQHLLNTKNCSLDIFTILRTDTAHLYDNIGFPGFAFQLGAHLEDQTGKNLLIRY